MSLKSLCLETAPLPASWAGNPAHAVAPGTVEANSALSFDPFSPNASATVATVAASGVNASTSTTIAAAGGNYRRVRASGRKRTPGDPPTVYISARQRANRPVQSTTATGTAVFTVSLSRGCPFVVKVYYFTSNGGLPANINGRAEAGEDYTVSLWHPHICASVANFDKRERPDPAGNRRAIRN